MTFSTSNAPSAPPAGPRASGAGLEPPRALAPERRRDLPRGDGPVTNLPRNEPDAGLDLRFSRGYGPAVLTIPSGGVRVKGQSMVAFERALGELKGDGAMER